jgi:hypothetical protein
MACKHGECKCKEHSSNILSSSTYTSILEKCVTNLLEVGIGIVVEIDNDKYVIGNFKNKIKIAQDVNQTSELSNGDRVRVNEE